MDGSSSELEGSVRVLGPNGNPLNLDSDTDELLEECVQTVTVEDLVSNIQKQNERRNSDNQEEKKKATVPNKPISSDGSVIGVSSWKDNKQLWDIAEAVKVKHLAVVTGVNDSMIQMMKKIKEILK